MTDGQPSTLQSLVLRTRLLIGRKLYGKCGPATTRISSSRLIKGPCDEPELAAMKYVASHTSIPVPNILATHRLDGQIYIEMDYIRGATLAEAWVGGHLSADEKTSIVRELGRHLEELRLLKPPDDGIVAAANGTGVVDYRIGYEPYGPFRDHDAFHSFLRGDVPIDNCAEYYSPEVYNCHSRTYRSVFTHADINLRNIIIADKRISAIIDWQFAGWYPEYWEFTKSYYAFRNVPDWYEELRSRMQVYDEELKAERTLWNLYGEPGVTRTHP